MEKTGILYGILGTSLLAIATNLAFPPENRRLISGGNILGEIAVDQNRDGEVDYVEIVSGFPVRGGGMVRTRREPTERDQKLYEADSVQSFIARRSF